MLRSPSQPTGSRLLRTRVISKRTRTRTPRHIQSSLVPFEPMGDGSGFPRSLPLGTGPPVSGARFHDTLLVPLFDDS